MVNIVDVRNKLKIAEDILSRSICRRGILAGSGPRYVDQCWTRDAALALFPSFDFLDTVRQGKYPDYSSCRSVHIQELAIRQGKNGAIPILFADDFSRLITSKLGKCAWDGKCLDVCSSFVLKRIFDGYFNTTNQFPEFVDFPNDKECGLYRLTPGTTDSELMFAFAVYTQSSPISAVEHRAAERAVTYLEEHYVRDGLHHGADWRDTMEEFFRDKPLLTNNALLYAVYIAKGDVKKAEALKAHINHTFWEGETYLDYPGGTRFNPLGASLAVLHGLVPEERYNSVLAGFRSVDTPYGVTIECKHNAHQPGETEVIERTNGIVVWPFVVGFTILAAFEMGQINFAFEQFEKMHNLDGFAEWYDPTDGNKWGEYEQGWSAAMYVRVAEKLFRLGVLEK